MANIFDVEFEKLKNEMPKTPHMHFKLSNNVFDANEGMVSDFFENYQKQTAALLTNLRCALAGNTKKRILVVGGTGWGKTSLLVNFMDGINKHRGEKKQDHPMDKELAKIQFMGILGAKGFSENKKIPKILQLKMEVMGIVALDDLHELAYMDETAKKPLKDVIMTFEKEAKIDGLVVYTTSPYFFRQMLTDTGLTSTFNDIIFVGGLTENNLTNMVKRRINTLKIPEAEDVNPFSENALKSLVTAGDGNPRLTLLIANKSLEIAFNLLKDKENEKISPEVIKKATEELNVDARAEMANLNDTEKNLVEALASQILCTAQNLATLLGLDRSTVSSYLNNLERKKIVIKKTIGKENVYNLNPFIRNDIEKRIIRETEQTHEKLILKV